MDLLRKIAIKTRYFSVILFLASLAFTFLSLSLMSAEIYGGLGLIAGYLVLFSFAIFGFYFIAYINRYLLSKEFFITRGIYDLVIINSFAFLLTWLIFYIYIYTDIDINIFFIFHILAFIILAFIHFKKFNILQNKIIKIITKIINILFCIFSVLLFCNLLIFIFLLLT